MSFLKKFDKLKDKFLGDDDKKEGHGEEHHDRGYGSQPQYGGAPPPGASPPSSAPPLPPGWIAQWDASSNRYFYLEQATGRTQWDLPHGGYGGPPPGSAPYGGYPPAGPPPVGYGDEQGGNYPVGEHKKEKGGMMGKLKGAAAGGAIGGLLGHATGGHGGGGGHEGGEYHEGGEGGIPPPGGNEELPDETKSGSSVSSSDKEDVEEARDEYQEAVKDGDSASDVEEAREEYEEQYEETYED